jgi:CBS domain-containing protein
MTTLVRDLMHPGVMQCEPGDTLGEVAQLMIDNHHHRILVVDAAHEDSLPVGVLSSFDIVSEMAKPDSVWQR